MPPGTRDHDVRQNRVALLQFIEGTSLFAILDFGSGPGRDLKAFRQQDFLALDLPAHHFEGAFANASLLHVPSQALPRVLSELHATRKPWLASVWRKASQPRH